MYDIKYSIIDIESLKGLFTFQWRNENMEKAKMIECYNDQDIINLYNMLTKCNRSLYEYSIGYDKGMLNALCKFVEKGCTDIVNKLRRVNDYFIMGNINYFRLNREFWCDNFYKLEKEFPDGRERFENAIINMKFKYSNDKYILEFLEEFPYLLGKSKLFKRLNLIDIPKMLYYFSIRQDGIIRPSISLKNIQLYKEGYNITHDFEEIFDLEKLKELGMLDDFRKYSLNDVDFLFRFFQEECLPEIQNRVYACEAIKRFNPGFTFTENMIHSENNTNLLVKAFSLPDEMYYKKDETKTIDFGVLTDEHEKTIPMLDYIKNTGYPKFDEFCYFVAKEGKFYKKDKKLKIDYCEKFDLKYENDDTKEEYNGQIQTKVGVFNEFDLFETPTKIGIGGIHGAIENYVNTNVWVLDYRAFYSSIILKFKEYYGKLIDVVLYEALYNFRNFDVKKELKEIEDKLKFLENNQMIPDLENQKEELKKLLKGAKLLLNSLYGLLNSEFNFPFAHKQNGRFICLYGQYRAIELCKRIKKYSPHSNIINLNTDGVIVDNIDENIISKIISEDKEDDYIVLEPKKIDKIIQFDVNNYIKITDGKIKTKGNSFKTGIKQSFVRFEKLPCNVKNALNLINNDNTVDILPVLFHQKSKQKSTITLDGEETSKNTVYYLTNKDKGKRAIKHIVKPLILSLDNEIMYFTNKKEDADIGEYIKFARITQDRILNFRYNEKDEKPYIGYNLINDLNENNLKWKKKYRLKLSKLLPGLVCLNGWKSSINNILTIDKKPIPELSHYNMTNIMESTLPLGYSIKNDDTIVCLATNNKEEQLFFDTFETFTVFHVSNTQMYVFAADDFNIDLKKLKNTKILKNQYLPILTLDNQFTCNFKEVQKSNVERTVF